MNKYFVLIGRICRILKRLSSDWRTGLGLILLVTNQPIGYLILIACGCITASHPEWKKQLALIAAVGYGATWGMLGIGVLLTGAGLRKEFPKRLRCTWRAWKRFYFQRKDRAEK